MAPANAREALDMVRAGLGYLAAADAAQLPAATQAGCLRELERDAAVLTAARAWILASFTAGQGYAEDADYSAVSWLIHRTGITRGAAVGHTAWAKRTGTHPRVVAALAAGQVSEPAGRLICLWTGKLPEKYRDDADEVLVAAAAAGLGLEELAGAVRGRCTSGPAGTCRMRIRTVTSPTGSVKLATTFGGAGVIHGDLTAGVRRRWSGGYWTRCPLRRARRMTAARSSGITTRWPRRCGGWPPAGLLPERAGQPVKAWAHISLADLILLDGDSALQDEWTAQVREQWAARRAARLRGRRQRWRVAGRGRRRGHCLRRRHGPGRHRRRQRRRPG